MILNGRRTAVSLLTSLLCVVATSAGAQKPLSGVVGLSGTVLFGNTKQRFLTGQFQLNVRDSFVAMSTTSTAGYGETDREDGTRQVTSRSWNVSTHLDRPYAKRFSPLLTGGVEANFQLRVANRLSCGTGAKVVLHQDGPNETSMSASLVGDRTTALPDTSGQSIAVSQARWSLQAQANEGLGPILRLTHVASYQPGIPVPGRYLVNSTTTLAVAVTKSVAMTVTLQDNYDSKARSRGAKTNNDGQFVFGVQAGF